MNEPSPKHFYVINSIAGGTEKDFFSNWLEDLHRNYGIHHEVYYTKGEQDEPKIEKIINEYQPDLVVAAGGDGTVNQVAQLLLGSDIPLAIVPLGSGNGLSKDIGIPQNDPEEPLKLTVKPKAVFIDSLTANGYFFMHLCDVGFNAHIVRLFNKGESRGLLSYLKFTLKEYFKYDTFRYEIESDNGGSKGHAFMITVANSRQYGSNLTINPEGNFNDGKFEIVIIKRFPQRKIFAIFWKLLRKKINISPYSKVISCSEATIRTRKNKTLQADGEIIGRVNQVDIRIQKKNLRIVSA